ncbi:hypothetical protein BaRGS_00017776 [Batillaria attramentaria]|uniref:CBM2 domain-containing protein n=1 Tax=Batillaria attramentaria TaxID=370345 RepID=A0ABD0KUL7_9CAEN
MLLAALLLLVAGTGTSALTLHAVNHWGGGFQVEANVPICAELDGWKVHLTFSEDVDTLEVWVADATKVNSREFILTNKDFNGVQHNGDTLSFTFLGHGTGDIDPDVGVTVEGMADCSGGGGTLAPGETRPPTTRRPTTVPPNTG